MGCAPPLEYGLQFCSSAGYKKYDFLEPVVNSSIVYCIAFQYIFTLWSKLLGNYSRFGNLLEGKISKGSMGNIASKSNGKLGKGKLFFSLHISCFRIIIFLDCGTHDRAG